MTPDQMAILHAQSFTTPRPWTAGEFATILDDPLCFALVEKGGFLFGRAVAGDAEVLTLAVDPQARRRGVGGRLVQGFLAEAQKRDAATAFLEVSEQNHAAISLYLRWGFVQVGRRNGYYKMPDARPLDALILARPL